MRQLPTVILDIIILYIALCVMLLLRYDSSLFFSSFARHIVPFSVTFPLWILTFVLFDLYRPRVVEEGLGQHIARIISGVGVTTIISAILFYFFSGVFFDGLTPKTNLLIFALVFLALRAILYFLKRAIRPRRPIPILIIGHSKTTEALQQFIKQHLDSYTLLAAYELLTEATLNQVSSLFPRSSQGVIVYSEVGEAGGFSNLAYNLLRSNIVLFEALEFYELLTNKVNLDDVSEQWFIANVTTRKPGYEFFKRIFDFSISALALLFLSPVILITAFFILLTSGLPIIYAQKRVGLSGREITIYKFRTMNNKRPGESWDSVTLPNDARITPIGRLLRFVHLDELVQLWNVMHGDISLVGPRPESAELVSYYCSLPHYSIRHTVIPGITGWAQINYKPSTSIEEAYEKLKYDMYYIKHRSFFLDMSIITRTIQKLLFR